MIICYVKLKPINQICRRLVQNGNIASVHRGISLLTQHAICNNSTKSVSFISPGIIKIKVNFPIIVDIKRFASNNKNEKDAEESDPNSNAFKFFAMVVGFIFLQQLFNGFSRKNRSIETITWDYFIRNILPTGEVKFVTIFGGNQHGFLAKMHEGAMFNGKPIESFRVMNIPDASKVAEQIRLEEIKLQIDPLERIKVTEMTNPISTSLFLLFILAGTFLLTFLFLKRTTSQFSSVMKDFDKMFGGMTGRVQNVPVQKSTGVKFSDVAGMEEAKQEVMEFVHFLKNPQKYEVLGGRMPSGCLLTGPPGVGKTLLAKAVSNESKVPFLSKSGSDFIEMIGGVGAQRVRQLFKDARGHSPCIIYIDEIDAIGRKRSSGEGGRRSGEYDQTLNQILVEMDGMFSGKHQVIVMASTNRPDMLDPALLRPGRFDRHIYIDLPTMSERQQIFERYLEKMETEKPYKSYCELLARLTPGMSGADIANVCNEAAIYTVREQDSKIDSKHFEYAIEKCIAGLPKKFSPLPPEDRKIVATHECGHALVGWMLKHTDALMKVSIVPHTKASLGYSQTESTDRKLLYKEQLYERMCMALGGRAAESLMFNRLTTGSEDDVKKVTDMANAYVKHLGFSSVVGPLSFGKSEDSFTKPYSNTLEAIMEEEARKVVTSAFNKAVDILKTNQDKLEILSKSLAEKEILRYEDIEELIGPPAFGKKKEVQTVPFGPFASEMEEKST